jgi:hypothetical protein
MAEFLYNNSVTSSNGISPFYVNYRLYPTATNPAAVGLLNFTSKVYTYWIHTVHDQARKGLK